MNAPLTVEGEMTIYRAAELKSLLLGGDGGLPPAEVDLSAVSEIDCVGVQLLLLAQREARALSRPWRLAATSAAADEALDLLGLRQALCES